jgi:hypothetical protein
LSPNEMFAATIAAAGYVTMPLTSTDYVELLPVHWRTIGEHGIQLGHRHYDSADLNPFRHQPSGVAGKGSQWEIHYDPYDLSQVFVRDHRHGRWITAAWTHLPMVGQPFADFTWRAARQIVADRGGDNTDQTAVARALDTLLTQAGQQPVAQPRTRRVAARTRAVAPPSTSAAEASAEVQTTAEPDESSSEDSPITPFALFQAGDNQRYR